MQTTTRSAEPRPALARIPAGRAVFARQIAGLRMTQAARMLGLTWDALNSIETGDCSVSMGIVSAMAAAYDCDRRWLAGLTPELLSPVSGPAISVVREIENKIADPVERTRLLRSLACIGVL